MFLAFHLYQALFEKGRVDGALYLCGYAVEIALKVRVVKTLKWMGFPSNNKEFSGLQSFKSHDLNTLLYLCGWNAKIRMKYGLEWGTASKWDPEVRYRPPGTVSQLDANMMIASCQKIVGALL